jgi:glycosyltransferase involved in cell wall biosynthesis
VRRAVVVPSPIHDLLDGDLVMSARAEVKARHRAMGEEPFTVGMVGRFSPWKGQLETVRAFADAGLPENARLVFIGAPMFGEDAYEAQVRAEVELRGLDGRVDFLGHVDDVFEALTDLDVLVHASTVPEPFGQVLVEGMAAGVPVLATAGGGPSEIITDGTNGLLYPAGDVDRLGELLRLMSTDASLRQKLSRGGLERARDFAPARISPMVLQVYEELLAGRRNSA